MTSKTGKLAATLLATALAAGLASGAWAQAASGVNAASAGTADTGSAGNSNGGGLPQIEQQGDVSYTSGGVGLDESRALLREQAHWALSLRFTGPTADYLSGVHVRIVGGKGGEVLNTESMGPYMLVKLPAGNYTVYAKYKDQEKKQSVSVAGPGKAKAAFHWNIQ
ncbi:MULTISPECIES: carboxypeptidase regulatory-like domain-containing protein [unclassified Caballeronia]|uniref:carboxypeptidase regulatory-like domain-containing protein n=1 Tax=unclassified Caballeronia TaxID=2646786 RepID=UPI002860E7B5|nr:MULTISPECIES: carboxypeptidase regulatory-like domain-containing protein [unclassified Caballeronia]MDR5736552.1 carboxypeptidase regulatory-like domain-containing protein [Caballeronia sp. LZ016]MDR5810969.1 carboxypeptidase regulatory-like domain-containing protein [Caballeronia sp. LZ019]